MIRSSMQKHLLKQKTQYQAIIVGGGINGVGIFRDLTLRGIECLLVEKGDFSGGTSAYSSGMIHGGPRYMLGGDIGVTRLSCLDSGTIQKLAPHLLFRIPFIYTVYNKKNILESRFLLEGVETFFEAYDHFISLKNGRQHTRLSPKDIQELEPGVSQKNLLGGVSFDEWGVDVPRLCIENVVDGIENGSQAINHTEVIEVLREDQKIVGVIFRDCLSGEVRRANCDMLVNATGPWSPQFGKLAGVGIKLRGGKGIHLSVDRRLSNVALVAQCIDGREIFILPYENETVIGTTDDDYFDDLDQQTVTRDEIAYLLDGVAQIFPAVKDARLIRSWSGVRPTLYKRDCYEDALSREHDTLDHEKRDGVKGLVSVVGGKLASYRIMAKEVADLVAKKLGNHQPSVSHLHSLPGGDSLPDICELAQKYALDRFAVARLVYRHGSRAIRILEMTKSDPGLKALVCSCEPVTKAEIVYVVQNELAKTLSDIRRRTRLGMGSCQGMRCETGAMGTLVELGIVSNEEVAKAQEDYDREWWWNRACVMNGVQVVQEELRRAYGHTSSRAHEKKA